MSDHANHAVKLRTAQSAAISEPFEPKANNPSAEAEQHPLAWQEVVRIAFVAIAAAVAWFLGPNLNLALVLAGVACAIVGGYPIFHEAIENILERRMTMELSMAIAILAALAIREVFTRWLSRCLCSLRKSSRA
jgi:cation transport ATPase